MSDAPWGRRTSSTCGRRRPRGGPGGPWCCQSPGLRGATTSIPARAESAACASSFGPGIASCIAAVTCTSWTQVNLYQSAKGRTSSKMMMHILRKSSAHLLACGLRDINGYTRSDCNPADKASRDVKRWKQFQRARRLLDSQMSRLKATPPTAESGAREEAWPRAG